MFKGLCDLMGDLAKFADHRSCGCSDIPDLIIHATLQEHVIKRPGYFMKEAPHSIFHPAKFGNHRHCSSGYMTLVCRVIFQDHVIKCFVTL